ncbi:hypothetical protein [Nocardia jinanensis]|nr:hypothetical protein [Nocardia jinanensis]
MGLLVWVVVILCFSAISVLWAVVVSVLDRRYDRRREERRTAFGDRSAGRRRNRGDRDYGDWDGDWSFGD